MNEEDFEELSVCYVSYHANGRIQQSGTSDPALLSVQGVDGTLKLVVDDVVDCNKFYVRTTPRADMLPLIELIAREDNPARLVSSGLVDVPIGSLLDINGTEYETTDATVQLDFPNAGAYKMKLTCWPFYDKKFEVHK